MMHPHLSGGGDDPIRTQHELQVNCVVAGDEGHLYGQEVAEGRERCVVGILLDTSR